MGAVRITALLTWSQSRIWSGWHGPGCIYGHGHCTATNVSWCNDYTRSSLYKWCFFFISVFQCVYFYYVCPIYFVLAYGSVDLRSVWTQNYQNSWGIYYVIVFSLRPWIHSVDTGTRLMLGAIGARHSAVLSNSRLCQLQPVMFQSILFIWQKHYTCKSSSKINEAVYAISWAYKVAVFSYPCQSF